MQVDDGKITNIKFYGDFFGPQDAGEVADKLKGVRYERQDIEDAFSGIDTDQYFTGIPKQDIVNMLLD